MPSQNAFDSTSSWVYRNLHCRQHDQKHCEQCRRHTDIGRAVSALVLVKRVNVSGRRTKQPCNVNLTHPCCSCMYCEPARSVQTRATCSRVIRAIRHPPRCFAAARSTHSPHAPCRQRPFRPQAAPSGACAPVHGAGRSKRGLPVGWPAGRHRCGPACSEPGAPLVHGMCGLGSLVGPMACRGVQEKAERTAMVLSSDCGRKTSSPL